MLVCGPGVMCPTNDDKESVSVRYKKKKSKNNERSSVNFEPEKYEAALRSILGMIQIKKLSNRNHFYLMYYF